MQNFLFLIILGLSSLLVGCKKSASSQLDQMLETASLYKIVQFCTTKEAELQDRREICDTKKKEVRSHLDRILLRRLDLGIIPVIVKDSERKEIEELLQLDTELGLRYWEIWKSNVILE